MMTHCAPLTYFAESGIPGGVAFCAVWWHVTRRVAGTRPAEQDAEGRTLRVALLAAVVAVLVANLFYESPCPPISSCEKRLFLRQEIETGHLSSHGNHCPTTTRTAD